MLIICVGTATQPIVEIQQKLIGARLRMSLELWQQISIQPLVGEYGAFEPLVVAMGRIEIVFVSLDQLRQCGAKMLNAGGSPLWPDEASRDGPHAPLVRVGYRFGLQ